MSVLSKTDWGKTIYVNGLRVLSATITMAVILYPIGELLGVINPQVSFLGAIILPGALLAIGLIILLFFKFLGSINPLLGAPGLLMAIMMVIFIAVGDPLLFIIRKLRPNILPLTKFSLINPKAVLLVEKE